MSSFLVRKMVCLNRNVTTSTFFLIKLFFFDYFLYQFLSPSLSLSLSLSLHTHTHTHIYIYIYIYTEKYPVSDLTKTISGTPVNETERGKSGVSQVLKMCSYFCWMILLLNSYEKHSPILWVFILFFSLFSLHLKYVKICNITSAGIDLCIVHSCMYP